MPPVEVVVGAVTPCEALPAQPAEVGAAGALDVVAAVVLLDWRTAAGATAVGDSTQVVNYLHQGTGYSQNTQISWSLLLHPITKRHCREFNLFQAMCKRPSQSHTKPLH